MGSEQWKLHCDGCGEDKWLPCFDRGSKLCQSCVAIERRPKKEPRPRVRRRVVATTVRRHRTVPVADEPMPPAAMPILIHDPLLADPDHWPGGYPPLDEEPDPYFVAARILAHEPEVYA
jgi:hypothetical protein